MGTKRLPTHDAGVGASLPPPQLSLSPPARPLPDVSVNFSRENRPKRPLYGGYGRYMAVSPRFYHFDTFLIFRNQGRH